MCFTENNDGLAVYQDSYKVVNAKDAMVYKITSLNKTEKAIYNTIKKFQDDDLKKKVKEKETKSNLSKEVSPGDIVVLLESGKKNDYLYLGKGEISIKRGSEEPTLSKGYIYIPLSKINGYLDKSLCLKKKLKSLDDIENFIEFAPYKYRYNYGNYPPLEIKCISRKSSLTIEILGNLELINDKYTYTKGVYEYTISLSK